MVAFPDAVPYNKTYSQQMHVIAWHVNDKKEREDFTLYKGKEKKDPYSISHWKKVKGRPLGFGVVEDMFQPQIWHNYGAKKIKDQLDLASTTIFQSSDANLAARNVLTNLQNGDFIIHAVNQPITPVNAAPQGVQGWQEYMEMGKGVAEQVTSTPDAISGDTMPSGTAFRQVALLNTEAHSYFDYITENKGNYLEFLYREYFIPYIVKQLDNTDELVATLDSHELEFLDNEIANICLTDELKKQTLAGNIVSPIQLDQLRTPDREIQSSVRTTPVNSDAQGAGGNRSPPVLSTCGALRSHVEPRAYGTTNWPEPQARWGSFIGKEG
jgi:hypothetical protein